MQLSVLAYNVGNFLRRTGPTAQRVASPFTRRRDRRGKSNFHRGPIGWVAALAVDTGGATGVSCLNARQCVGGRVRQGDGDSYDPEVRTSAEPGGGQCV